jgi:hypothetical protein
MYFPATIKDGQLSFNRIHLPRFTQWAREHEGARLSVGVDKPKRTVTQNSYYWCYLGIVEPETGQLATDVHEWAKRKFLPARFITVNGEEIRIPASTTDLDKIAFGEYLDKLSAEISVPLPDPEAAGYLSNY